MTETEDRGGVNLGKFWLLWAKHTITISFRVQWNPSTKATLGAKTKWPLQRGKFGKESGDANR